VKLVSSARDLRRDVRSRPLRLAAAAGLAVVALGGLSACAEGNPKHRTDFTTPGPESNPSAVASQTGPPPEATVVSSPTPTAVPTTAEPTATGSPESDGAETTASPTP
jgi:hypothetical protein